MKFINLTPHAITVIRTEGPSMTIAPEAVPARVSQKNVISKIVDGVAVYTAEFGDVVGLPAPQVDTIYIVSAMVKSALRARASHGLDTRRDCVSPGNLLRDAAGNVIGCEGFIE